MYGHAERVTPPLLLRLCSTSKNTYCATLKDWMLLKPFETVREHVCLMQ